MWAVSFKPTLQLLFDSVVFLHLPLLWYFCGTVKWQMFDWEDGGPAVSRLAGKNYGVWLTAFFLLFQIRKLCRPRLRKEHGFPGWVNGFWTRSNSFTSLQLLFNHLSASLTHKHTPLHTLCCSLTLPLLLVQTYVLVRAKWIIDFNWKLGVHVKSNFMLEEAFTDKSHTSLEYENVGK